MIYRRVMLNDEIVFGMEKSNGLLTLLSEAPWNGCKNEEIKEIKLSEAKLLPISDPKKVIGVAQNYEGVSGVTEARHEPLIFLKSPASVIGPGEPIKRPFKKLRVWGESELAIIVGDQKIERSGKSRRTIFGYTLANDVTSENINGNDHHLARSKCPNTFCPLADFVDSSFVPNSQMIRGYQNGLLIREAPLSKRILNDQQIINLLDEWMTLFPGDVVLTGAPPRIGDRLFLKDGDVYSVQIENLGCLENVFHD